MHSPSPIISSTPSLPLSLMEYPTRLPLEVEELVRDASCNITEENLWGIVGCQRVANCSTDDAPPKGASVAYPVLLFTTGIVGQILALVLLYRTPRHNTRTVVYVMLRTLLWTDLVGKVVTTPPAVLTYIKHHWVGGRNLCHYHGYVMSLIGLVTHLLVCAMAVERLLGIRHGYFYNQNITTYRVKNFIRILWGSSLIFCSLPLFGVGRFVLQYPGTWCFIDMHPCSTNPSYMLFFTYIYGTINILCLLTMVVCNIVVVGTLLKMRLSIAMPSLQSRDKKHRSRKHSELEIQMVFCLLVITTVFIISWGPLDVVLFANSIWPHEDIADHVLDFWAIRLVSLNQIVNPWAYIICRVAYRSKLCQCCRQGFAGRRFSLLEEGKRSSLVNSLRSLRKISRATKEPTPPDLRKDIWNSEQRSSDPVTANQDSGNSFCDASNLLPKPCDASTELHAKQSKTFELVTYDVPKPSTEPKTTGGVRELYDGNRLLNDKQNATSASNSPRQCRIDVNSLLLHPLARVVSNKSFKRLKDEEDFLRNHKRAHSLDGSPDQLLLVVPLVARCRSDQTLKKLPPIAPNTAPATKEHGHSPLPEPLEKPCLSPVNCEHFFKHLDTAAETPSSSYNPTSEKLLSDEAYFSSYTSNSLFMTIDKDSDSLPTESLLGPNANDLEGGLTNELLGNNIEKISSGAAKHSMEQHMLFDKCSHKEHIKT